MALDYTDPILRGESPTSDGNLYDVINYYQNLASLQSVDPTMQAIESMQASVSPDAYSTPNFVPSGLYGVLQSQAPSFAPRGRVDQGFLPILETGKRYTEPAREIFLPPTTPSIPSEAPSRVFQAFAPADPNRATTVRFPTGADATTANKPVTPTTPVTPPSGGNVSGGNDGGGGGGDAGGGGGGPGPSAGEVGSGIANAVSAANAAYSGPLGVVATIADPLGALAAKAAHAALSTTPSTTPAQVTSISEQGVPSGSGSAFGNPAGPGNEGVLGAVTGMQDSQGAAVAAAQAAAEAAAAQAAAQAQADAAAAAQADAAAAQAAAEAAAAASNAGFGFGFGGGNAGSGFGNAAGLGGEGAMGAVSGLGDSGFGGGGGGASGVGVGAGSVGEGGESAGVGGMGDGGGGGGGKIICTKLYKLGLLNEDIYLADQAFGAKLVKTNPDIYNGYRAWAEIVVDWMEGNGPNMMPWLPEKRRREILQSWSTSWAKEIATPWAEEMAYKMGVKESGNTTGKLITAAGIPICKAVGVWQRVFGPSKKPAGFGKGAMLIPVFILFKLTVKLGRLIEGKKTPSLQGT
jgi:hypothetical protein